MDDMNKPLILYHKGCFDGFSGAWAAWKFFGEKAEYLGLEHQTPAPVSFEGRDLYFIDFCYPVSVMKKIKKVAKSITVLDHHESQQEAIRLASTYVYETNHSGCVIAWRYFFPKKPIPKLLLTVEDSDLFLLKRPFTREISAFLGLYDLDFSVWSKLAVGCEQKKKYAEYIQQGKTLLAGKDKAIEKMILKNSEEVILDGHRVVAVNTALYYSEAGNKIYKRWPDVPFAITWYYRGGKINVSLRSNCSVDVSKIAVKYGGGGHPGAAGFSFLFRGKFPWKPVASPKILIG